MNNIKTFEQFNESKIGDFVKKINKSEFLIKYSIKTDKLSDVYEYVIEATDKEDAKSKFSALWNEYSKKITTKPTLKIISSRNIFDIKHNNFGKTKNKLHFS